MRSPGESGWRPRSSSAPALLGKHRREVAEKGVAGAQSEGSHAPPPSHVLAGRELMHWGDREVWDLGAKWQETQLHSRHRMLYTGPKDSRARPSHSYRTQGRISTSSPIRCLLGSPSWPLPDAIEGNCTFHNSPRFVFPSNSRWPIWGQPRPLGAGRCGFLMSCVHMDTRTSGAAMCCLGQASPGEPIRGPRGAGRQQGPASELG